LPAHERADMVVLLACRECRSEMIGIGVQTYLVKGRQKSQVVAELLAKAHLASFRLDPDIGDAVRLGSRVKRLAFCLCDAGTAIDRDMRTISAVCTANWLP